MAVNPHEKYMFRCLQLAALGAGNVAPNPMVGAVLVHGDIIIGEGYHTAYGEAHAEVNCISQVADRDYGLIEKSTLYVSLEPCAHFGKTPPCADLIIKHKIPKVVIGCRDPFKEVNGKGIERLKAAGIDVTTGVLNQACTELNKRFFCFHTKKRPYVILKWAQSFDGKIAASPDSISRERVLISNGYTNRLVHKWRSAEPGILVGKNTALHDDPSLTTRLWKGNHPVRFVTDTHLRLPAMLRLFDKKATTVILNSIKDEEHENLRYYMPRDGSVQAIVQALHELKIQSVIVEGGTKLLQSFIDGGVWDEARIITNNSLVIGQGYAAPSMPEVAIAAVEQYGNDTVRYLRRQFP